MMIDLDVKSVKVDIPQHSMVFVPNVNLSLVMIVSHAIKHIHKNVVHVNKDQSKREKVLVSHAVNISDHALNVMDKQ